MSQSTVNLVLHPIRMRILMAMAGHELTASKLAEILPDVPQATLYRNIKKLADAGVLRVVEEHQVRGTLERVYTLDDGHANLQPAELAKLNKDEHMRLFVGFLASLLDDYTRYLENSKNVDLVHDGVGYRKAILYLSDADLIEISRNLNQVIAPYLQKSPSSERKARLFSTVLMPDLPTANNNT